MLDEGGFSTPCPLDHAADPAASGYVTPAANARALSTLLCGALPVGLPLRRGQFLLALEARQAGSIRALLDALPSDPADPINVAWFHTVGVVAEDRLAQLAKLTQSLADAQLAAVIASARPFIE